LASKLGNPFFNKGLIVVGVLVHCSLRCPIAELIGLRIIYWQGLNDKKYCLVIPYRADLFWFITTII
jgi:hypothetical protein